MNRDAILATIIGFLLGLAITTAILIWPKISKYLADSNIQLPNIAKNVSKSDTPSPSKTPQKTGVPKEPLTIDAPIPDAISTTDEMLVSGSTIANSHVIVAGTQDEIVIAVQSDGKYAGKVTLTEGKNTIQVSVYDGQKLLEKNIAVYYSPST